MEHLSLDFSSQAFWTGVVLTILLEIIARRVDDWLLTRQRRLREGLGRRWNAFTDRARARRETAIRLLVESPQYLQLTVEDEVRLRIRAVTLLVICTSLFATPYLLESRGHVTPAWAHSFVQWIGMLGIAWAAFSIFRADRSESRLRAARFALDAASAAPVQRH